MHASLLINSRGYGSSNKPRMTGAEEQRDLWQRNFSEKIRSRLVMDGQSEEHSSSSDDSEKKAQEQTFSSDDDYDIWTNDKMKRKANYDSKISPLNKRGKLLDK